jgi:hypothetical protein
VEVRERQEALARERHERYRKMLADCEIRAPAAGIVVYGSTGQERGYRGRERIEANAQVRERPEILRIPKPGDLGAKVSVHESRVESVKVGQRAWVSVGARTDRRIAAEVRSVASMADSQSSWWNPDLKVYTCQLAFLEPQPDLKPGMSAQVEILVAELEDVLAVPPQCVTGPRRKPVVWVWNERRGAGEPREVVLGLASDHLVEVREGLEPGERVLLAPPTTPTTGSAPEPGEPDAGAPDRGAPEGGAAGERGRADRERGSQRPEGSGPPPSSERRRRGGADSSR